MERGVGESVLGFPMPPPHFSTSPFTSPHPNTLPYLFPHFSTPSDEHDKPFCAKAIPIIDNFKKPWATKLPIIIDKSQFL